MAGKAQNFTQRQHMLRPGYEIFRYCDSELGEVSLHQMCIRDRLKRALVENDETELKRLFVQSTARRRLFDKKREER